MSRLLNSQSLIGERFGRLKVTEFLGKRGNRRLWRCLCDCGKESSVTSSNLMAGSVLSCGCLAIDATKERSTTHGMRNTRLYVIWSGMKKRCSTPSPANKYHYGKGITVCDEWKNDFSSFKDWALSNGYLDDLTLDRINPNLGYAPGNCRWATYRAQALNSSACIKTSDGEPAILVAALNGIARSTFYSRRARGWSIDDAANILPSHRNRHGKYKRHADVEYQVLS